MRKLLVFLLAMMLLLCGCGTEEQAALRLDRENSYFSDFSVQEDEVHFDCVLSIANQTNESQMFQILGDFSEDADGGLLKNGKLTAHLTADAAQTEFVLAPNATTVFKVTFTGTYGGTAQKQDRLLPEITLIPT